MAGSAAHRRMGSRRSVRVSIETRAGSDFQPESGSSFRDSPAESFEQVLRLAAVVGVGAPYADQSCTRANQISCNLLQQIATV